MCPAIVHRRHAPQPHSLPRKWAAPGGGGGTRPSVPADEVPRCITDTGWVCVCPQPHLSTHTHTCAHDDIRHTGHTYMYAPIHMHTETYAMRPHTCAFTHACFPSQSRKEGRKGREERGVKNKHDGSPRGAERKGPEVAASRSGPVPTSALSPAPPWWGTWQPSTGPISPPHGVSAWPRAQGRPLPGLQVLDAGQHVQVAGRVLLDHVHHIVGPQALLELTLGHQEPHDTAGQARP